MCDCVHEETVAQMCWDIEDSYKRAMHALSNAETVGDALVAFGRKQAFEELMNCYVSKKGV